MKIPQFYSILFLLFICALQTSNAQNNNPLISKDFKEQKIWVDSIYNSMSLQEKVGQLFMVDVFSNKGKREIDKIREMITEQHIGGIIFSKGGPLQQATLNNEFQELSKTPLLIGMDAEWGLAMRLDSTFALPWNMTMGAIQDLKLIEEAGAAISRNSKRLGVHINFAPVVDINTNPDNPIIGNRSFGEEKINVTLKAVSFMRGMHKEGILSSAKHFPGHGDTKRDSHKFLPIINFIKGRLDSVEFYPFKKLIEEGVSSIMVAHLNVPSLEIQENVPSSISKSIVTDLLKKELKFNGLVFTDALNMKGASNYKNPGEIDLAAFLAGNDILLMSEDVKKASIMILDAYNDGTITEERLAHSVRKILFAKYKAGLNDYKPVKKDYLIEELNTVKDKVLYDKLIENAITIIKNDVGIIPLKELDTKRIAYVNFGDDEGAPFYYQLAKYAKVDWVKGHTLEELLEKLKAYNQVIIGYHKSNASPWAKYAFDKTELTWIHEIARNNSTILNVFTIPYALRDLNSSSNLEGIVVSYQNSKAAQEKSAQIIFGALDAKGRLPVSISEEFPVGTGYYTKSINRLSYGYPEAVGMNSYKLQKIDSLINRAIDEGMTPGVQLLIARKGKVIFQRNAGYHTYEKNIKVTDSSLYDLASLTKILASLPMIMELEEAGDVKFSSKLGDLMPIFKGSNKQNIKLQDLLMHYARLTPWIPFYISTLDRQTKERSKDYYREEPTIGFNLRVADSMYMRDDIGDSILKSIRDSKMEPKLSYKYSDLPFYIMKYYIEDHYNKSLSTLTKDHFYKSLGANTITFTPLDYVDSQRIVPTEVDKLWRNQEVLGYVHDQGAAMQGGIGGHAGLFSNATDVAKMMQLYLNGGKYGGKQYFKQETLDKFNTCYYCEQNVRRGVGFDKPQLGSSGPTCGCVSLSSFGHTGFTGTLAWADPDKEIVYIFLSNRTYPDVNNRMLIREDIREKIQSVIYESIDF